MLIFWKLYGVAVGVGKKINDFLRQGVAKGLLLKDFHLCALNFTPIDSTAKS